jgi:hypothetical protein
MVASVVSRRDELMANKSLNNSILIGNALKQIQRDVCFAVSRTGLLLEEARGRCIVFLCKEGREGAGTAKEYT